MTQYGKAIVAIEGFEDDDTLFEALIELADDGRPISWNGFVVPYLNRAQVDRLVALSDEVNGAHGCSIVKWDDEKATVSVSMCDGECDEDDDEPYLFGPEEIDGVDYWSVGGNVWTWYPVARVHDDIHDVDTNGTVRAMVVNDQSVYAFEAVDGAITARLDFAADATWFEWMNRCSFGGGCDMRRYNVARNPSDNIWNGQPLDDFDVIFLQQFDGCGIRRATIVGEFIGSKVPQKG